MNDFLIGLLSALVATNQPVALSNLIARKTGVIITVPNKNDPVEQEYQRLLADDDAAQAEVDTWIEANQKRLAEGDTLGTITLKLRIKQRYEPVKKAYEDFLLRNSKHARARLAYGSFLNDIGEEEAAKVQIEKAVELDPQNPAAWNNLANFYGHNGPVTKAFECYGKALELKPTEAVYYQNLATTMYLFRRDATNYFKLTEQQVFDRALALYRQALEFDPTNFLLATDFAQSYYGIPAPKTGDLEADRQAAQKLTDEALAAWRIALKLARDDKEREGVHIHLARTQINAGRLADARKSLSFVTNAIYAGVKQRLLKRLEPGEDKLKATNAPPAN